MKEFEDLVVDEFLVMRCQVGDRTALSALVAKWQPAFLRYATITLRDPDLAADVLQDAWIKILRNLPSLRDPLKYKVWAYRIISNQCMDAVRRRRPVETITEVPEDLPFGQLETREQVWRLLETLSPDHRSVLALHYLQGFEVVEIARITGKPQGTIKSRLHHAREKFRQAFGDENSRGEEHERTGQPYTGRLAGSH